MLRIALTAAIAVATISSSALAADFLLGMQTLKAWDVTSCEFTGCWHDYAPQGAHSAYRFQVSGNRRVHTGGELRMICTDGNMTTFDIPDYMDADEKSAVFPNECGAGKVAKLSLQIGLAARASRSNQGFITFFAVR